MYCYAPLSAEPKAKRCESELVNLCQADLSPILGIKSDPQFTVVSKHPQAMAQYQVGHQEVVSTVERLAGELPGFAVAGNGYHGVGIPDCIRSGEAAAISLLDRL